MRTNFILIIQMFLLCGCVKKTPIQLDGPPEQDIDVSHISNASPRYEPYSSLGNPPYYIVNNEKYIVRKSSTNFQQKGIASWYGKKFHGRTTSNGENYDMLSMSAAHKELPLPTYLKVTNLDNNKQIIVRVNDRGPFVENRIIDLSYAAAKKLGMLAKGTANVHLEAIETKKNSTGTKKTSIPNQLKDIYIQIGAFRDGQKAMKYMNKLKNLLQYNIIAKAEEIQNQIIYKIQVGPIKSIEDSHLAINNLKKYISTKPIVLMR